MKYPKMSETQRRTIRWEKVTRGPLHTLCGVNSIALARVFPLSANDNREAIVGFNGMVRENYVWYYPPAEKGEPEQERVLCQIEGVSKRGVFEIVEFEPQEGETACRGWFTLPGCCEPADINLGHRLI